MRRVVCDIADIKGGDFFIPFNQMASAENIKMAIEKGARILDVPLISYFQRYRKKLNAQIVVVVGPVGKSGLIRVLSKMLRSEYRVLSTDDFKPSNARIPLTILNADFQTQLILIEVATEDPVALKQWINRIRPTHIIFTGIGNVANSNEIKQLQRLYLKVFSPIAAHAKFAAPCVYLNTCAVGYDIFSQRAMQCGYTVYPYSGENKSDEMVNVCFLLSRHIGLSPVRHYPNVSSPEIDAMPFRIHEVCNIHFIDDSYQLGNRSYAYVNSLIFALEFLKRQSGRKILVLGDELDQHVHSEIEYAAIKDAMLDASISLVMSTGNPNWRNIFNGISWDWFNTTDALFSQLRFELKSGDWVFIKTNHTIVVNQFISQYRR